MKKDGMVAILLDVHTLNAFSFHAYHDASIIGYAF